MDAITFLKSLPAVLGIVGFFAYLWAGQYRIGSELMKAIVEKLRAAPNVDIKDYASLTPARIEKLIQHDTSARNAVNEQDIKLIRLIVLLQYAASLVVFIVCASLIGLGIYLISRPEPLTIIPRPPTTLSGVDRAANAPLLDLESLKAEWDTKGEVETVAIFLENVDADRRTAKKSVLADVHSVSFSPSEYREILTNREYHGINRVRTVVEWTGHTERSKPVDLFVGIKVRLMIGGTLITPDGSRPIHTLLATIDDSTATMPKGYCFNVDFAGWDQNGPLVAPLKSCNSDSEVALPFLSKINWSHHVGLVFNQPSIDQSLTRMCIAGPDFHDTDC